jgi:DNA polymerase delta subunit 4
MDAFVVERKPLALRSGLRSSAAGKLAVSEAPRAKHDASLVSADPPPLVDMSKDELEDELRMFDYDPSYGPFVGVRRLTRWERARRLGLNPPERIRAILLMSPARVDGMREGGNLW